MLPESSTPNSNHTPDGTPAAVARLCRLVHRNITIYTCPYSKL